MTDGKAVPLFPDGNPQGTMMMMTTETTVTAPRGVLGFLAMMCWRLAAFLGAEASSSIVQSEQKSIDFADLPPEVADRIAAELLTRNFNIGPDGDDD